MFLLYNNLICDFIHSLAFLTALDGVFDKSEYLIFSCIGLNNEQPLSCFDATEGEVNFETGEFFMKKCYHCYKVCCVHYFIPY